MTIQPMNDVPLTINSLTPGKRKKKKKRKESRGGGVGVWGGERERETETTPGRTNEK